MKCLSWFIGSCESISLLILVGFRKGMNHIQEKLYYSPWEKQLTQISVYRFIVVSDLK